MSGKSTPCRWDLKKSESHRTFRPTPPPSLFLVPLVWYLGANFAAIFYEKSSINNRQNDKHGFNCEPKVSSTKTLKKITHFSNVTAVANKELCRGEGKEIYSISHLTSESSFENSSKQQKCGEAIAPRQTTSGPCQIHNDLKVSGRMAKVDKASTFTEKWEVLHGDGLKSKGSSDTLKLKGVVPERAKCFFNPLFSEEESEAEEIDIEYPILIEKIEKPIKEPVVVVAKKESAVVAKKESEVVAVKEPAVVKMTSVKTVNKVNSNNVNNNRTVVNNSNVKESKNIMRSNENIKKKEITSSTLSRPIREEKDSKAVVTFENNTSNKSININYLRQHSKITNNNNSNNHNTFKSTSNSNISNQHSNKALSNKSAHNADKNHSGAAGPKKHGKHSESEIRAIIEKETGYKFVGKGRPEISAEASLNLSKKYQSLHPPRKDDVTNTNASSNTSRPASNANTNTNRVPKTPYSLTSERIRRTVSKYVRDSTATITTSNVENNKERRVTGNAARSSSNGGRSHYYTSSKYQSGSKPTASNGYHR